MHSFFIICIFHELFADPHDCTCSSSTVFVSQQIQYSEQHNQSRAPLHGDGLILTHLSILGKPWNQRSLLTWIMCIMGEVGYFFNCRSLVLKTHEENPRKQNMAPVAKSASKSSL